LGDVLRFSRAKNTIQQWKTASLRRGIRQTPWPPLFALLAVAAAVYAFGVEPPSAGAAAVGQARFERCVSGSQRTCVIDGDTIRYEGLRVRLEDIDAPEIFSPRCESEKALGQRATQRLLEWLNAGSFQMVQAGERDEDVYGRKLRVIERNGRSAGDVLVSEGLARRWDGARRSWCG
jgi:endonuclease YncB( thermonuclease family)